MPHTAWQRAVYQYSGIPIDRQGELRLDEFYTLRRDAFIFSLSQTENGREYLEECFIAEQTEPDRERLRKHFDVREV